MHSVWTVCKVGICHLVELAEENDVDHFAAVIQCADGGPRGTDVRRNSLSAEAILRSRLAQRVESCRRRKNKGSVAALVCVARAVRTQTGELKKPTYRRRVQVLSRPGGSQSSPADRVTRALSGPAWRKAYACAARNINAVRSVPQREHCATPRKRALQTGQQSSLSLLTRGPLRRTATRPNRVPPV